MYNPYDLVKITINNKKIDARPIEFDSEIANNMTMLNAHGNIVIPTKLSTICPTCGNGMILDVPSEILQLNNDPELLNELFETIDWPCKLCNPDASPPENPFMNPVEEQRVGEHELDPLLHDPTREIKTETTTVADRIGDDLGGYDDPEVTQEVEPQDEDAGSADHGTNASLVPPDIQEEDQEDTSEATEDEGAEEPQLDSEVEEELKEDTSEAEKMVELELGDEIGEEEEIDDLEDLEDLE